MSSSFFNDMDAHCKGIICISPLYRALVPHCRSYASGPGLGRWSQSMSKAPLFCPIFKDFNHLKTNILIWQWRDLPDFFWMGTRTWNYRDKILSIWRAAPKSCSKYSTDEVKSNSQSLSKTIFMPAPNMFLASSYSFYFELKIFRFWPIKNSVLLGTKLVPN